jgi:hypothetical protein
VLRVAAVAGVVVMCACSSNDADVDALHRQVEQLQGEVNELTASNAALHRHVERYKRQASEGQVCSALLSGGVAVLADVAAYLRGGARAPSVPGFDQVVDRCGLALTIQQKGLVVRALKHVNTAVHHERQDRAPQASDGGGQPSCDPNYSGACVPIVSYDLDCADISGTVYIKGSDPHGFDGDGDGVGCE